jgi:alpha-1,3-glucan synthase
MPLEKSVIGCKDDWNSLDHFDPTTDTRRMFTQFNHMRKVYGALQDGFNLVQRGNWTYYIVRPGSNDTATEMGLWSISRSGIQNAQTPLTGIFNDQIWMLYTNENSTKTYAFDCKASPKWLATPFMSGTVVKNLFAPYEAYTLQDSLSSYYNDSKAPYFGCLPNLTMEAYGFKALVPVNQWVAPLPALTKFLPGHDARIHAESGDTNATTVDISLEFSTAMDCTSVTSSISFNMSSSGKGSNPSVQKASVSCGTVTNPDPSRIPGGEVSQWAWSATLNNVPDGILTITLNNPQTADGTNSTGVSCFFPHVISPVLTINICQTIDNLMLRKGSAANVMVFPDADYDDGSSFSSSNGNYTFTHKAFGADMFRYSWNFGMNWTTWKNWEDTTIMAGNVFDTSEKFWKGQHIMVQCEW